MRASRTHMMRLYARTKNRKKGDRRQKTKANNVIFIYIYIRMCIYTYSWSSNYQSILQIIYRNHQGVKEYMSMTRSFRGERINILIKKEERKKNERRKYSSCCVCMPLKEEKGDFNIEKIDAQMVFA